MEKTSITEMSTLNAAGILAGVEAKNTSVQMEMAAKLNNQEQAYLSMYLLSVQAQSEATRAGGQAMMLAKSLQAGVSAASMGASAYQVGKLAKVRTTFKSDLADVERQLAAKPVEVQPLSEAQEAPTNAGQITPDQRRGLENNKEGLVREYEADIKAMNTKSEIFHSLTYVGQIFDGIGQAWKSNYDAESQMEGGRAQLSRGLMDQANSTKRSAFETLHSLNRANDGIFSGQVAAANV